jgi:TRAP-type C4-dicarboxylate transport system permease small subunit
MDLIRRIEHALTFALDVLISFFFTVILSITILQVLLRYGFNAAILGGNETMEGLFIYTTALGAAIAVRRRQHISIDIFLDKFPNLLRKTVDVFGLLMVAFLNAVMIYYSVPWIKKVGSHESPVMRIPEWTIQVSIPIGCGFVLIYCLYLILLLFIDKNQFKLQNDQC